MDTPNTVTLPSAVNVAAVALIVVASLALELQWNAGAVTDATRHTWQLRLVTGILACAAIQVFIRWREGGYARDAGEHKDERAKGFPVIRDEDDE